MDLVGGFVYAEGDFDFIWGDRDVLNGVLELSGKVSGDSLLPFLDLTIEALIEFVGFERA